MDCLYQYVMQHGSPLADMSAVGALPVSCGPSPRRLASSAVAPSSPRQHLQQTLIPNPPGIRHLLRRRHSPGPSGHGSWQLRGGRLATASMDEAQIRAASTLRIQNLLLLCKQLRLPVHYKVHEVSAAGQHAQERRFTVIVHVHSDYAFRKYFDNCSHSDLLLFRGLLLTVVTDPSLRQLHWAEVQQAFLPKFENEGQDQSIAAAIVEGAAERYQVVTIKHSGSLVTLSKDGFAAKNSINNAFTAAGALLLQTHYQRLSRDAAEAQQKMQRLMEALQQQHLVVSFEMVTGCHGHHGQLPAGEYLVATAAHVRGADGAPQFLPWVQFLDLCLQLQLPLNDTWLIAGQQLASDVRQLLDDVSIAPCSTGQILQRLNQLAGAAGGSSSGGQHPLQGIHMPGTYPHDQWQGTRLEGFVIAQGQPIAGDTWQQLQQLQGRMAQQVIDLQAVPQQLRQPYAQLVARAEHDAEGLQAVRAAGAGGGRGGPVAAVAAGYAVKECAWWLPQHQTTSVDEHTNLAVIDLLRATQVPVEPATCSLVVPGGAHLYSRAALKQAAAAAAVSGSASQRAAHQQQLAPGLQQQLQAVLAAAASAAERHGAAGGPRDAGSLSERAVSELLQQVSGSSLAEQRSVLRYKKKMMLYTAEVVGYCMMTFVIRNGLPALKLGRSHYLTYLNNLARRSWQLPASLADKVLHYGRCWAAWVGQHGGAKSVSDETYLLQAERFVAEFLAGKVAYNDPSSRAPGTFQGVLVAVHLEEDLLHQLVRDLQLTHCLMGPEPSDPANPQQQQQQVAAKGRNKGGKGSGAQPLSFSRNLVAEGSYLNLSPDTAVNKQQLQAFLEAAAPYVFLVAPQPSAGGDPARQQKKHKGHADGPGNSGNPGQMVFKVGLVQEILRAKGLPAQQRTLLLQEEPPAPRQRSAAQQQWVADSARQVVQWLGPGTRLQPAAPTYACCFITIPGTGKSYLCHQLQQRGVPMGSLAVLNGDDLDKLGKRGMRYWAEVVGAVTSAQSAAKSVLVIGDKNLVPSPPNMIGDAAAAIKQSGATSIALVPTLRYVPHVPASELPAIPLELLALCMLRVLQRKNHNGGLDGDMPWSCGIVALFGSWYQGRNQQQLVNQLVNHFDHVVPLVLGQVDAQHQVPKEVLDHVARGLYEAARSPRNRKRGDPVTSPEWETRMRALLSNPANQAALQALQLPGEQVTAHILQLLADIASGARKPDANFDAARGGVKWYGIQLLEPKGLQEQLKQVLERQAGAAQQQQLGGDAMELGTPEPATCDFPRKVKGELHVTLWHEHSGPGPEGMVEGLAASVGQQVTLQLVALDCGPKAVAAQVQLLEAPDAVSLAWQQLGYPHITVATAEGVKGVASLQLPAQVADPQQPAFSWQLSEPLTWTGQLMPYS